MRWLLRLVLMAVALYLTSVALCGLGAILGDPGLSSMKMGADIWSALLAVLALSLVNSLVGPVLRFFGAPLNFMTLGLFGLIVNSVLFWAVGYLSHGYQLSGVVGLFAGPIIMGAITGLLSLFIPD